MRFRFRNTLITCVTSHLAANDGMVEKRNSDYREIIRRLQFPVNPATPAEAAEQLHPISSSIFESDVLIWMVCSLHYYDPHLTVLHCREVCSTMVSMCRLNKSRSQLPNRNSIWGGHGNDQTTSETL
jgi:hypothetical protein